MAPATLGNESSPQSSTGTVSDFGEGPSGAQDGEGASPGVEVDGKESPVDDSNAEDTADVDEESSSMNGSNRRDSQEAPAPCCTSCLGCFCKLRISMRLTLEALQEASTVVLSKKYHFLRWILSQQYRS